MLLKTERLTIRYIIEEDWPSIRNLWENFNASQYSQYDHPHNTEEEDVRVRISKWARANSGHEHMFFAVCYEDIFIGYVAFNVRENGYEIGYCFHSDYHGKGYAKESISIILEYMNSLGITKFIVGTAMNNRPSVALLRALGFKLVDTERVSFYKDDQGNDIVFDGGIFELDRSN